MKKILHFCIFCCYAMIFVACSDDDNQEDQVTITVSPTNFTAMTSEVIDVPFTVTPTDYTITASSIEIKANQTNISGALFPATLTNLTRGDKAGTWTAHLQINGTGNSTLSFCMDRKYTSNSFTVTASSSATEEIYTTDAIIWYRTDTDFETKESVVDLSAAIAECGGIEGLSSTKSFQKLDGTKPVQDFCIGTVNASAKTFTVTMIDADVTQNGVWYWILSYTRTDNTIFEIRIPLKIGAGN